MHSTVDETVYKKQSNRKIGPLAANFFRHSGGVRARGG